MAEALIPTVTNAIALGTAIQIHTQYLKTQFSCCNGDVLTELPNIQLANFYDSDGSLNSVIFQEGELVVSGINMPIANDIWINNMGELIISGSDAIGYEIDENGDLIYDYCPVDNMNQYYECGFIADNYIEQ